MFSLFIIRLFSTNTSSILYHVVFLFICLPPLCDAAPMSEVKATSHHAVNQAQHSQTHTLFCQESKQATKTTGLNMHTGRHDHDQTTTVHECQTADAIMTDQPCCFKLSDNEFQAN